MKIKKKIKKKPFKNVQLNDIVYKRERKKISKNY